MLSAVFLGDCNTVHEYKEKIKALSESDRACLNFMNYEIAECFHMKYEDYIYLCNHLNERFARAKKVRGYGASLSASMFFNYRADKVLLVSFADFKVAVLYNSGQKVELRPNSHRARDLRNAEKRSSNLYKKMTL